MLVWGWSSFPLAVGFISARTNEKSSNHPDSSSLFFTTKLEGSHISPKLWFLSIFWIFDCCQQRCDKYKHYVLAFSCKDFFFSVKLLYMTVNNKSDLVSHCCLHLMLNAQLISPNGFRSCRPGAERTDSASRSSSTLAVLIYCFGMDKTHLWQVKI